MIRSRFADETGDGTGNINAATANGSVGTPVIFRIAPPINQVLYVKRMVIFIADPGTLDSGGYGNGTALTNGILLRYKRFVGEAEESDIILPNLNQLPITQNQHWKALCHDEIFSNYGAGDQSLSFRYTFEKDTGDDLIISGPSKEQFQVIIQDNLTTLCNQHYFRFGMKD